MRLNFITYERVALDVRSPDTDALTDVKTETNIEDLTEFSTDI